MINCGRTVVGSGAKFSKVACFLIYLIWVLESCEVRLGPAAFAVAKLVFRGPGKWLPLSRDRGEMEALVLKLCLP